MGLLALDGESEALRRPKQIRITLFGSLQGKEVDTIHLVVGSTIKESMIPLKKT